MKLDFKKMNGLIPAVVQDNVSKRVLMIGFMNEDAYAKTLSDGFVTFWSRGRNCLWQKGENSGNKLKVIAIKSDCDSDSLLIMAEPFGPTCHTGNDSCFEYDFSVGDLFKLLSDRKNKMPDNS